MYERNMIWVFRNDFNHNLFCCFIQYFLGHTTFLFVTWILSIIKKFFSQAFYSNFGKSNKFQIFQHFYNRKKFTNQTNSRKNPKKKNKTKRKKNENLTMIYTNDWIVSHECTQLLDKFRSMKKVTESTVFDSSDWKAQYHLEIVY